LTIRREFVVTGFAPPAGPVSYAHFSDTIARSPDEAIGLARRRLHVALSAVGIASGTPINFEILDAYYRPAGSNRWSYMGRQATLPLSTISAQNWGSIISELHAILVAEDELARRVQESLIHLHRADAAYDAEDRLDEAWKVLELIGKWAESQAESLLCYLPLYFVRKDFATLSAEGKIATLREKYQGVQRPLLAVRQARDKALAHRPLVRADAVVLEHHGVWATGFAKEAVSAAIVGWSAGARKPEDLKPKLEEVYLTKFSCRIPSREEMR